MIITIIVITIIIIVCVYVGPGSPAECGDHQAPGGRNGQRHQRLPVPPQRGAPLCRQNH